MSILIAVSLSAGIVIVAIGAIVGIIMIMRALAPLKKAQNVGKGLEKNVKDDNENLHDQLEYATSYQVVVENLPADTSSLPPYNPPSVGNYSNVVNEKITPGWVLGELIRVIYPAYGRKANATQSLLDENQKLREELRETNDACNDALDDRLAMELEDCLKTMNKITADINSMTPH